MIGITLIGASGRMGRALVRAASQSSTVRLAAAVVSDRSTDLGQDAGLLAGVGAVGVQLTRDLPGALGRAHVALDFSSAAATAANVAACRRAGKPLLIGTTGVGAELGEILVAAAREIPLLVAPNTSSGIALLIELVRAAARTLPPQFDIEILEAHHRSKRDAPSGTALALGQAAAEGRSQPPADGTPRSAGPRVAGEIGFAVLRAGDIVGEHTVLFAGEGERLSLSHQVTDRAVFARGALEAAVWLTAQPPGLYSMRDVIGYKSES